MKGLTRLLLAPACLFVLGSLTAGTAFAVDMVFKDPQYSFQTLRTLGYAASGGADVGEVL